jgi:hypothetical protein
VKKIVSGNGKDLYHTAYLKINKTKYRLKRVSGKYFSKLLYEYEIIKELPELHITPPLAIAYSIDEKAKQCFILFKYPPGYIVLKNLLEYNMHPSIIADFDVRKKDVMKRIVRVFQKMYYTDYYYPHWNSDNVLVKNKSDEIALVDLEDFRHLNQCPWYYRIELCSWFIRRRQWKTLLKTLAPGESMRKFMKDLKKKKQS